MEQPVNRAPSRLNNSYWTGAIPVQLCIRAFSVKLILPLPALLSFEQQETT